MSRRQDRTKSQLRTQNKFRNRGNKTKYVTIRSLNGGKMLTTNDPPPLTYQPWNHITLAWHSKPKDHNFGDLVNQIKSQIDPNKNGFSDKLAIQMKIHSVRVWNLTGKTISLTVYDYHDDDNVDQLCGLMDAGANPGVPRIGYELPLSFRQQVMRNDSSTGKRNLFTTAATDADTILQYVRIEWRFDGPVKGPSIDLDWERRLLEKQSKALEVAETTSSNIKKLLDSQPSTVERIISGITHHAAEVAMLAEERNLLEDVVQLLRSNTISSYDTLLDVPSCSK